MAVRVGPYQRIVGVRFNTVTETDYVSFSWEPPRFDQNTTMAQYLQWDDRYKHEDCTGPQTVPYDEISNYPNGFSWGLASGGSIRVKDTRIGPGVNYWQYMSDDTWQLRIGTINVAGLDSTWTRHDPPETYLSSGGARWKKTEGGTVNDIKVPPYEAQNVYFCATTATGMAVSYSTLNSALYYCWREFDNTPVKNFVVTTLNTPPIDTGFMSFAGVTLYVNGAEHECVGLYRVDAEYNQDLDRLYSKRAVFQVLFKKVGTGSA
jgi:hypothetical protein